MITSFLYFVILLYMVYRTSQDWFHIWMKKSSFFVILCHFYRSDFFIRIVFNAFRRFCLFHLKWCATVNVTLIILYSGHKKIEYKRNERKISYYAIHLEYDQYKTYINKCKYIFQFIYCTEIDCKTNKSEHQLAKTLKSNIVSTDYYRWWEWAKKLIQFWLSAICRIVSLFEDIGAAILLSPIENLIIEQ